MQAHHYLGALPKIGHTIRYIATIENQWVGLLSFSAPALKCAVRDDWIGWGYRHQFDRLNLVANNSRFLILPGHHYPNLASRILSRSRRRIQQDWLDYFSQPLLLLETFVDPTRFQGTIYRASNWRHLGSTKGYQRTRTGYAKHSESKKWVFVQPLQRNARRILSCPILDDYYQTGKSRMKLTADQMFSLSDAFKGIDDARRAQGRKHHLANVLSLSAGAILCGMRGYNDIALWAASLSQQARSRFRCRKRAGRYEVPSRTVIRNVLIKVDPEQLDWALNVWNNQYAGLDESLAIDGKTMCNALDSDGKQTHIMSAIGHESTQCYTQKKLESYP
jgi:hypothetical protein